MCLIQAVGNTAETLAGNKVNLQGEKNSANPVAIACARLKEF